MAEPHLDNLLPPPEPEAPLVPPSPVGAVDPQQATGLAPPDPETAAALGRRAEAFADDLVALPPHSPAFAAKVEDIASMGAADLRATARLAARALAHQAGPTEPTAQAARGLAELRRIVSSLDPGGRRRRFLGGRDDGLPAGYFDRYRDAQDDLDAALAGLLAAQDGLRRANAAAEVDRGEARGALAKLTEYATLAGALDAAISRQATELDVQGQADAARALATEALPAVRQRHQDVLTHAAVVAQGYLALEVVRRHNVELIRGIERARKATASALRAAAAASAAVAGQELVLDRIRAVDTAAAGAAEGGDVDTLRAALGELAGTLDDIERYRTVAVDNLAQTAGALGPTAANPPSGGSA